MDVLAHYTTYKTYYGLIKEIEADPEVPRREAAGISTRSPKLTAQKVATVLCGEIRFFGTNELKSRYSRTQSAHGHELVDFARCEAALAITRTAPA
jgi:hypothetical protein